jgi:hypothetical protein
LTHDALIDTYKRLGTDKPHISSNVKEETEDAGPKRPLSPSESGAAQTTQPSIDVKPEELKTIKLADVEQGLPEMDIDDPATMTIPVASESSEPKKRGRPRKSEGGATDASVPYQGLFEAVIRNDLAPPVVEIRDLRQDVSGGEKLWTEPIRCLMCQEVIH